MKGLKTKTSISVMVIAALAFLLIFTFASGRSYGGNEWGRGEKLGDPRPGTQLGTQRVVLDTQILADDLIEISSAQYTNLSGLAVGSREAQQGQREVVERLGLPLEVKTRKMGITFRLIPAATFSMGSPLGESDRKDGEREHQVTLTNPYYCGKFEVTQEQFQQVMGRNPSSSTNCGNKAPVEWVSWEDCQEFLQKLCQIEGVPQGTYRLLTEAQWEHACRAGTTTRYHFGESITNTSKNEQAIFHDDISMEEIFGVKMHPARPPFAFPVCRGKPNSFGLYNMHGNVSEWCQDWYDDYPAGIAVDPIGPSMGEVRVLRGGHWYSTAKSCRSAARGGAKTQDKNQCIGLRIMRTIPLLPGEVGSPTH